jgi:hypothetical protein
MCRSILCLFYGTFHAVLHARTLYSTFLDGVRGEAAKFCNFCKRLFFVFVGKLVLKPESTSKSNFTPRKRKNIQLLWLFFQVFCIGMCIVYNKH